MWILYACGSALFAGITAILAKTGIKTTDSNVATALRTVVVFIFSWLVVFVVGSQNEIGQIPMKTLVFLILSGFATGASWLCYFKALQLGDVNKVIPIDKSSIVLTILLAFLFLRESVTVFSWLAITAIGVGTYLMIEKKTLSGKHPESQKWLVYAVLSAVFASLTSILGKMGISGIESNLGTAIRTAVVLILSWVVVLLTRKKGTSRQVNRHDLLFICLSGVATGASWLCYYRALQEGPTSMVVAIDKLSIIISMLFSYFILKETYTKKTVMGLSLIVLGTFLLLI